MKSILQKITVIFLLTVFLADLAGSLVFSDSYAEINISSEEGSRELSDENSGKENSELEGDKFLAQNVNFSLASVANLLKDRRNDDPYSELFSAVPTSPPNS